MNTDEAMKKYLFGVQVVIMEHGWSIQSADGDPPIVYTVGLAERGLPDLAIVGLPVDVGYNALDNACRRHREKPFTAGQLVDIGASALFKPVTMTRNQVGWNMPITVKCYGLVPALQLYWPNRDGFYPDDPDAPPGTGGPGWPAIQQFPAKGPSDLL